MASFVILSRLRLSSFSTHCARHHPAPHFMTVSGAPLWRWANARYFNRTAIAPRSPAISLLIRRVTMTSEAARHAGRAVFRHLESFCEQLIDNFCGAARRGLTRTPGIAALTLLPPRAFWRPAIPDCVISASIVALLIHVASDSSQFQSRASSGRPPIQWPETLGAFVPFKGCLLRTTRTGSTRPRKRVDGWQQ